MTQARDLIPLRMQLTPMQVAEANLQPVNRADSFSSDALVADVDSHKIIEERGSHELVIYPGEPSEILVQLENLSDRSLYLDLQIVEKNFPSQWCRIGGVEGHQLPPRGKIEAVIYFQIAADFFESHQSWQPSQSLILDYSGRLDVRYAQQLSEQTIESPAILPYVQSEVFTLYVRSRSLYLNFLPDIYREIDFIGRLLKIFEQAFEPAVQTLDTLWAYLDPLTAPETLLSFLAHWVGWQISPSLNIERQRYLIRQAMEIYRWRGTRKGLRFYLHLYLDLPLDEELPEEDKHICIQEVFGRGFITGDTKLGQDSVVGGGRPYHFIVSLRFDNPLTENEKKQYELLGHQIIKQEKPAFCTYELYISDWRF